MAATKTTAQAHPRSALRFEKPFSNKLADQRELVDTLYDEGVLTISEYVLACQNLLIQDAMKSVGYNTYFLTPRSRERRESNQRRSDERSERTEQQNVDNHHSDS